MLSPHQKRLQKNKRFHAFIPNFMANPFQEKLKKEEVRFTDWLKDNIEKYLKKK